MEGVRNEGFKRAVKLWFDILVYMSAEVLSLKLTHIF